MWRLRSYVYMVGWFDRLTTNVGSPRTCKDIERELMPRLTAIQVGITRRLLGRHGNRGHHPLMELAEVGEAAGRLERDGFALLAWVEHTGLGALAVAGTVCGWPD